MYQIGIIGGKGKFGVWFHDFFLARGMEVLISDVETDLSSEEVISASDVVLFCLPLSIIESEMSRLSKYAKEGQLWMDIASIKSPLQDVYRQIPAEGQSVHPMFAPSLPTMKDQMVIGVETRLDRFAGWFEGLVTESKGQYTSTTAENHDKAMAVVQGVSHFSSIVSAILRAELGIHPDEFSRFMSPVYTLHLAMEERIFAQDPELYADIQIKNPYAKEMATHFAKVATRLSGQIASENRDAFLKAFEAVQDHIGAKAGEAFSESDSVLQSLSGKGNQS